jgi:hypothetical protein
MIGGLEHLRHTGAVGVVTAVAQNNCGCAGCRQLPWVAQGMRLVVGRLTDWLCAAAAAAVVR